MFSLFRLKGVHVHFRFSKRSCPMLRFSRISHLKSCSSLKLMLVLKDLELCCLNLKRLSATSCGLCHSFTDSSWAKLLNHRIGTPYRLYGQLLCAPALYSSCCSSHWTYSGEILQRPNPSGKHATCRWWTKVYDSERENPVLTWSSQFWVLTHCHAAHSQLVN